MKINIEMINAALAVFYGQEFLSKNDKTVEAAREAMGFALKAAFTKALPDDSPRVESKSLIESAKRLVDKIDDIHASPEFQGIWPFLHVHGMSYKGPSYEIELKELKDTLQRSIEPPLKAPVKPLPHLFTYSEGSGLVSTEEPKNALVSLSDYQALDEYYEDRIILMNKELEVYFDTLYMYANPSSYHAITVWGDSPCGEFIDDIDDNHDDPAYNAKPGRRAREAMVQLGKLMGVEISYNLW